MRPDRRGTPPIRDMEFSKKNKRAVTRYLLGVGDEEEQTAMEEKYLSDQEFFEQVVAVEKELLDNYARNRLSSRERELFERHYLAHPKRRARAMTASALATTLDRLQPVDVEAETSPWLRNLFAGFRGRRLAFGMTVAAILFAAGEAWFFLETRQLRSELTQSRVARTRAEQREKELQGLLAEQQGRNERLSSDLEKLSAAQQKPAPRSAPTFVSLLLTAGLVRDGGQAETSRLVIPAGIEQVRLRLKIKEGGYPRYRVSIQTADGRILRTLPNLRPNAANVFTIALPSRLLTSGEYALALSGINENGESDSLSKTLFRVESKALPVSRIPLRSSRTIR